MKGFFKLTTAALALVAMASCSNDELLGDGQAVQGQSGNVLQVEVEDMIDNITTRAAYVPNGTANQLWWQDGDVIEVFDETMLQNDTYEFSWKRSTFENNSKDLVKTPAFAFTNDVWCTLSSKIWNTTTNQVVITYDVLNNPYAYQGLAASGVDNEIASTKGNKVKAFDFSIPMWGEATKTDAGVKVNMKYLTGVLRVQMAQLPSDWGGIRVTGYKDQACYNEAPMTGSFKAIISDDDEIDEKAQLVELSAYDKANPDELGLSSITNNDNVIEVMFADFSTEELDFMRANGGYVYIPLIAQSYGALQFWYYDTKTTSWKLYRKTKPVDVKRGTVYRMNVEEFEIAGSDAESLNVLLKQKKDETGAVTVKTTYPTDMKEGKNVIKIPAGMKADALTFDLEGINGDGDGSGPWPFEIESEDGKYAGAVVLDLGDGTVTNLNNVYLNLPNSDVTIKGNFNGASFGNPIVAQNKLIVKSLTIAPITEDEWERGFLATNLGNIIPNYESFSEGDGIVVQKDATVGNIFMTSISENGDKFIEKSSITIYGTAGDIQARVKNPAYMADKEEYYAVIPVTVDGGTAREISTASDITLLGEATANAWTNWGCITASGKAKTNTTGTKAWVSDNKSVTMSENTYAAFVDAKEKVTLSDDATADNVNAVLADDAL
jgi:hypothetical protein